MASNSGVNLTTMAYYGRQTVKFGLIAVVVLMVGRTFLSATIAYWKATHPAPPPPPTARFGALPALHFPARTQDQKPASYQLQTPTGGLPVFGDRAHVYLMPKSVPSLLADQGAKSSAAALGFTGAPTPLSDRTYRWTKNTPINLTLEMDIQNKNLSLASNFLSHPELFNNTNLPANDAANALVQQFLSRGVNVGDDIATVSGKTQFLQASGQGLAPAVAFSDADFIQLDIWRAPVNGLPVYTPDSTTGTIHAVILGGLTGTDAIVTLSEKYHPITYSEFDDYPLRSVSSAWQLMQAGEGFVANKGTANSAVIRRVVLGYYDDYDEQSYFQPIYVFLGDGGFVGYVSAVDPRYVAR